MSDGGYTAGTTLDTNFGICPDCLNTTPMQKYQPKIIIIIKKSSRGQLLKKLNITKQRPSLPLGAVFYICSAFLLCVDARLLVALHFNLRVWFGCMFFWCEVGSETEHVCTSVRASHAPVGSFTLASKNDFLRAVL